MTSCHASYGKSGSSFGTRNESELGRVLDWFPWCLCVVLFVIIDRCGLTAGTVSLLNLNVGIECPGSCDVGGGLQRTSRKVPSAMPKVVWIECAI